MPLGPEEWGEVSTRLIRIQRALVTEQDDFKQEQRNHQRSIDELCLGLIDVLDLVECLQAEEAATHMDKVARRIRTVLKRHQVQELVVSKVEPHSVKVIDTRASATDPAGSVLSVCRKGYLRGQKVLRPAEVITSK